MNHDIDFSAIPELNYAPSAEEEVQIERFKEELRSMGYESFGEANDFHPLFWDLTRQGKTLTMVMKIAVIDMTTNVRIIPVFLGMARRYNGWMQARINAEKSMKDALVTGFERRLKESQEALDRSEARARNLEKKVQASFTEQDMNTLRHDLKKEYNRKVLEIRRGTKAANKTAKKLLRMLRRPSSRFFRSFDLRDEKDVCEYVGWFELLDQRIKAQVIASVRRAYPDEDGIAAFLEACEEHNHKWTERHGDEDPGDLDDDDVTDETE